MINEKYGVNMNIARQLQTLFYLAVLGSIITPIVGAQVAAVSSQLCVLVGDVRGVIGVLALVLFIIGGVLYAVAHFLPTAGQIKGNLQGWSMGMVLGGIIGIILVLLAPYVVSLVVGFGGTQIATPTC